MVLDWIGGVIAGLMFVFGVTSVYGGLYSLGESYTSEMAILSMFKLAIGALFLIACVLALILIAVA